MMKKVCVYIDGFNVFHAIKKAFGKKYYWINYKQLARQYIDIKNEKLVDVYYFSAYFYVDKEGVENHKEYVRALQRKGVKIILGKYLEKDATFVKKRHPIVSVKYGDRIDTQKEVIKNLPVPDLLTYNKYEEKRTDVNMAVQIVIDGLQDKYDKAIIITGDSDIAPAIEAIKRIKQKEFLAVIPIGRKGQTIAHTCGKSVIMREEDLYNSPLPEVLQELNIPINWVNE